MLHHGPQRPFEPLVPPSTVRVDTLVLEGTSSYKSPYHSTPQIIKIVISLKAFLSSRGKSAKRKNATSLSHSSDFTDELDDSQPRRKQNILERSTEPAASFPSFFRGHEYQCSDCEPNLPQKMYDEARRDLIGTQEARIGTEEEAIIREEIRRFLVCLEDQPAPLTGNGVQPAYRYTFWPLRGNAPPPSLDRPLAVASHPTSLSAAPMQHRAPGYHHQRENFHWQSWKIEMRLTILEPDCPAAAPPLHWQYLPNNAAPIVKGQIRKILLGWKRPHAFSYRRESIEQ